MGAPKHQKLKIEIGTSAEITLYAGAKVKHAIDDLKTDMSLWTLTRHQILMKAIYEQGLKDGRKEIIDKLMTIPVGVNYLPPGRPKNKTKPKKIA